MIKNSLLILLLVLFANFVSVTQSTKTFSKSKQDEFKVQGSIWRKKALTDRGAYPVREDEKTSLNYCFSFTDSEGNQYTPKCLYDGCYIFELTLPGPGTYNLFAQLDGHADFEKEVVITKPILSYYDPTLNITFLPGERSAKGSCGGAAVKNVVKAVLTWGELPKDLDLYSKDSNNKYTYWRNPGTEESDAQFQGEDALGGSGEETIIMRKGQHELIVYNFSNEVPFSESQAKVTIFVNDEQVNTYNPTNASGRTWRVASVNVENGEVNELK